MNQYYQGDILFLQQNKIKRSDFKKLPIEGVVVAEGEITGHKHTVIADPSEQTDIRIAQDEKGYYLKVIKGNALVTHEEHKTIVLPIGDYQIIRQVEYDELTEFQKVQD